MNQSAPLRFKMIATVDGGTRLVRAPVAMARGSYPLWAAMVERRPANALLRDIEDSEAANAIFN